MDGMALTKETKELRASVQGKVDTVLWLHILGSLRASSAKEMPDKQVQNVFTHYQ